MAYQMNWSESGVAMLGPTESGKTTFLCALKKALLEHEEDWVLFTRDPASQRQLEEMSSALISEGGFPMPTRTVERFRVRVTQLFVEIIRDAREQRRFVREVMDARSTRGTGAPLDFERGRAAVPELDQRSDRRFQQQAARCVAALFLCSPNDGRDGRCW